MLYLIINPITNKLIEFSEFPKDDATVTITGMENGNYVIKHIPALCKGPIPFDESLFSKTYNPATDTFE